MGNAVAVSAVRELGHDAGCVWHTVTILALGNHLVFLQMTGYAEERLVFRLAGNEHVISLGVTGSTLF